MRLEEIEKKKTLNQKKGKNRESLTYKAYKQLETMIITLQLKPGSLWSEKELAEILEIGRMPVREAIQKLEAGHLLTIMPRKGIMVTEISREEFALQMDVRRPLERIVVTRAARLSTDEERAHFIKLAEEYEKATVEKDEKKAVEIDNEFNEFIAECARNPYASSYLGALHSLARRLYYMQYNADSDLTEKINYAHCELMRAVASGDEKLAQQKSDYLLDCVEKLNQQNFDAFITGIRG